MKYKLLYTVIIPILLLGCGDNEDSLSPSNIDRDWFIIEDNPNDQVDHQRYLLYQEYRLPIFYNDTIGEAEIVHPHGGTYTHYEILQTFYIPSSLEGKVYSGHFSLCPPEKKNQLLPALSMLEKTIIPQISKKMYITSILLVDTLLVSTTGIGIGSPATNYKGFNTWIIGDIFKIAEMDEEEMKKYGIICSSISCKTTIPHSLLSLQNFQQIDLVQLIPQVALLSISTRWAMEVKKKFHMDFLLHSM